MDREQTIKAAEVMTAWARGETIQARVKCMDTAWFDCPYEEGASMMWDWSDMDYQLKRSPLVRYLLVDALGMYSTRSYNEADANSAIAAGNNWVAKRKFIEVLD